MAGAVTSSFTSQSGAAGGGGQAVGVAVVVIDPDQVTRSRLAMQLGQGATPLDSIDELAPRLSGFPVVMVLGPSIGLGPELEKAAALLTKRPELGAILVAEEVSADVLQLALRAGVRDVLAAPVDTAELTGAVTRVASGLSSRVVAPTPAAPSGQPADDYPEELGQVVCVYSAKGGSGTSVIASSLAVTLARRSERPVCIVDADLQFGDVAVMLKLAPQHTLIDAVSGLDRLDASLMQSLLVEHKESGLLVLPAPLEPAHADQIGASELVKVIEILRALCAVVIIDTQTYLNEATITALEVADEVLLVTGLDIPSIKNTKIALQTMRLLDVPSEKVQLVLNRADSKVRLEVGDVQRTLGLDARAMIPSDVVVPQAVNKGAPVVLDAPKSGVARAIEELADLYLPSEVSAGESKKGWRR